MGRKQQLTHPNANRNKVFHVHHNGKKRHTAIVFDQKQRDAYLKGMFGAKKRRAEFAKKKAVENEKQSKKQQKASNRAHRKDELQKAKQLLFKLKEDQKKQDNPFQQKQINIKTEGNLIIQTKFY